MHLRILTVFLPKFFLVFSLALASFLFTLDNQALADSKKNLEASSLLFKTLWQKDKKDAVKPSIWGGYSYAPVSPGKIDDPMSSSSFKIVLGKKIVLSPKEQDNGNSHFLLVHPLTRSKFRRCNDIGRLVNQVIAVDDGYARSASPLLDINGDGKPEVIVAGWSIGEHGTFTYRIYTLEQSARLYAEIVGGEQQMVFADLNSDGRLEAIGYDFTFAYWNACFADSPAPLVVLSAGNAGFEISEELMRVPPLSDSQMRALAESCKRVNAQQSEVFSLSPEEKAAQADLLLAPELWKMMLDMIYTGNSKQAWTLIDMVWPSGKKALIGLGAEPHLCSKEAFISEFLNKLAHSPYLKGLKELNSTDSRLQVLSAKSPAEE